MICKKCGAQIEDASVECKFCGTAYENTEPIEEAVEKEAPPEEVPGVDNSDNSETDMLFDENEIKRQRQIERMKAEKQSQLDEIEKRRKDKHLKQKRTKLLVILAALLCAGLAAFGGYYIFNNDTVEPEIIIASEIPSTEAPVVSEMPTEEPTAVPEPSEEPTDTPSYTQNEETVSGVSGTNTSSSSQASAGAVSTPSNNTKTTQNTSAKQSATATAKPSAPKPSASKPSASKPATSTAVMGGTSYNADGGMTNDKFTAALVTGGEVVKNGDRIYMSFRHNGSTYYAKVSANTTTNFIAGKAMTLSAYKISEMYNGVNVYEITAITHYNGTYVFPNSGFKLLTESDLAGKTDWELRVGRNEIYARHGRKFKDSALQNYFNGCSWYRIKSSYDYSNDANNLNAIERANADFIRKYEDSH